MGPKHIFHGGKLEKLLLFLKISRSGVQNRPGVRVSTFCIKISTVSPNDLFVPAKIELRPDLAVEISIGNTSDISTAKSGLEKENRLDPPLRF